MQRFTDPSTEYLVDNMEPLTPVLNDGTQIWKITHNGVDTHPIHFHATDVQILNRVTWDNIIIPPDATELGWKETVRISPLEDTIVAMRPAIPTLPFDFANSVRLLSPMMTNGSAIDISSVKDLLGLGMGAFAPNGEPIDVINHFVNFGAEYVYHCHILSHEEMDMMHAVLFAFPPVAPGGLTFVDNLDGTGTLSWTDESLSETAFVVEKSSDGGTTWVEEGIIPRLFSDPLRGVLLNPAPAPRGELLTLVVPYVAGDQYRVFAQNTVGDTWDYANPNFNEIALGGFPTITTKSAYATVLEVLAPAAPTNLTATLDAAVPQVSLAWVDNAVDETGFVIERSDNGGAFVQIGTAPADSVGYVDTAVAVGNLYDYHVAATNGAGTSAFSNIATVDMTSNPPAAPANLAANLVSATQVDLSWADNATTETGFVVERSDNSGAFAVIATLPGGDIVNYIDGTVAVGNLYVYQVAATNGAGQSGYSNQVPVSVNVPDVPQNLSAANITRTGFTLNWEYPFAQPDGFEVQVSTTSSFTAIVQTFPDVGADLTSLVISGLTRNNRYYIRIRGFNVIGPSAWSPTLNVRTGK